jgi:hypothetical protein
VEKQQYDNEKTGFLWHETDSNVMRKGSLTLNGKKHYVAIIESYNDRGEPKYEFMMSAGLLHINKQHEKVSENSPDIGGAITINEQVFKLGGWKKMSKNNQEYTSISIKPKEEKTQYVQKKEDLSDVPF